ARAGGHVGDRGDLQRRAVPVAQQALAQDRVADLSDLVDLLELGVLHPVAALEDRVHQHVDVLVDRGGDEKAAVLAVVGRQVGAPAAQRDAQRRAAEDHAHAGPGAFICATSRAAPTAAESATAAGSAGSATAAGSAGSATAAGSAGSAGSAG